MCTNFKHSIIINSVLQNKITRVSCKNRHLFFNLIFGYNAKLSFLLIGKTEICIMLYD